MSGVRSTLSLRRLLPGLLAATILPATAFAALVVATPGAGASTAPAAALNTPSPFPPTPTVTPGTSPFPPSAPTDLTVVSVTSTSVTLSWTAAKRGCCEIVGYDIQGWRAYYDVGFIVQVGNVTTATIPNLGRTLQYSFSVSARDFQGRRSGQSNSVVAVLPNTDTGDTQPPSEPEDFALAGQTETTAQLSWSPSTDNVGVTGYDVYRFDGLFVSTRIATVTDTTVEVPIYNGRNQFYVRARDAAGNLSAVTNSVSVTGGTTLPTPPTPPVTTGPPETPGLCTVSYTTTSEWSTGFVASVTIRNASPSTAIDGWTLTYAFGGDQQITSAWSAKVTQSGAEVTAQNLDWNRTIPAGGSVTFGMYGSYGASNAAPASFKLNGSSCVVGS